MLKQLRIKFVCVNMAIVVSMLAIIFGLLLGFTRSNLEEENKALMRSALGMGEQREPRREGAGPAPDWAEEPERREDPRGGFLPYILVELDQEGGVREVRGYLTEEEDEDAEAYLNELVAAALAEGGETGVLSDYGVRYLLDETREGTKLVFTDLSGEKGTMNDLLRTSLILGGASLAVFFLISLLLSRWAVRPVEEAWKQQKQFVSDASHELKTPLTVIMTNAELLQSPDYDAPAKKRFGENILTMSHQMRGLVESLLELARIDNGALETGDREIDFSELCAQAVLPFEPLCFEKGLLLSSDIPEGIRVQGSGSHLRQVIEILLDNAQKYADPDTEITVTLRHTGRSCLLSVADRGKPIAPEDLPHLFERFYRADKARSRDGSFGLGLSIAQKIVENHHGKIWAESAEGLNTFFVSLPAV